MNLSQCAIAFASLGRALQYAQADVGEDSVEGVGELAAAITDQELMALGFLVGLHEDIASGLGDPRAGGVGGDAEQVSPTGAVFEHDQCVDVLEIDSVNVQEVDGDDVLFLGLEELLPGRSGTTWGGVNTSLVQDVPHGGGRCLVAEAGEFAVDTSMPPSRVLRRARNTILLGMTSEGRDRCDDPVVCMA